MNTMFEGIKRYFSERYSKKWWKAHHKVAQRTKGKREGIAVREEMVGSYFDEGKYGEAATILDELAEIVDKYPETEDRAPKYRQRAKSIRDKAESKERAKEGRLESGVSRTESGISRTSKMVVAVIGISLGIFFLSFNLTGNAIANLTNQTSSIIGAVFFIIGILAMFLFFKKIRK